MAHEGGRGRGKKASSCRGRACLQCKSKSFASPGPGRPVGCCMRIEEICRLHASASPFRRVFVRFLLRGFGVGAGCCVFSSLASSPVLCAGSTLSFSGTYASKGARRRVPRAARSGGERERESIIRQSRTKQALPTREKQQVLGLRFAKGNQAKPVFQ
jgi:hypothetical protein